MEHIVHVIAWTSRQEELFCCRVVFNYIDYIREKQPRAVDFFETLLEISTDF